MSRHRKPLASLLLIALGLFALTSCNKQEATPSPVSATQAAEPKPAVADIALSVASVDEFEESVKSHAGKVVVVDLWAIW